MHRLVGTLFTFAFMAIAAFMVYRVGKATVENIKGGGILIGMWFLALIGLMANGLR
ncbi:MAG TPA: hypothetical protein VMW12_03470 [Candidatus Dormibacteraeota bacterium]|nr:hypothetical protein [Candidatus Dormibacteraeota bacterium]